MLAVNYACNPTRDRWINRKWHTLTGHYNVYFNGEKKFNDAMETLEKGHQDDFTNVLEVFPYGNEVSQKGISGVMDEVTKKASLTIQNHNVGSFSDNAYLLMGKSQYFKRDYYAALEPFQYINSKYKDKGLRPISTCWVARCYMGLKKEGEAEAVMGLLLNEVDPIQLEGKLANSPSKGVKVSAQDKADIYATAAEIAIKQQNYPKAIEKLTVALDNQTGKPRRIRYTYILAQLYQMQGKTKESNKYFKKVLHMLAPYSFEFNASINLAKSYDSTDKSAVRSVRRSLKRMLNDDKNDGLYDQIYFELGNLEYKEKNIPAAIKNYKLAASKSTKNPNQKGLSYLALANIFLSQPEYKLAQAYYDSAANSFKPDYKDYEKIMAKKTVLSELISNLVVIETEDSLQKLSMLTKEQLEKKIDGWILSAKQLAEQKAKADKKRKEIEKSNELNQGIPMSAPSLAFGGDGGAQWYFYNQAIVVGGTQEFFSVRKWGQRANTDFWRIAAREKESASTDQAGNKVNVDSTATDSVEEEDLGKDKKEDLKSSISTDKKAWVANVPYSDEETKKSNDKILEAYYNIGLVYDEKLNDQKEAANDFLEMLKRFPGSSYEPEVYYRLYKIYSKHKFTQIKAEEFKTKLITKYPESPYALILQNKGLKTADNDANKELVKFYEGMYGLYLDGNYEQVKVKKMEADKKFPGNSLQAKFELLNTLAIGKTESLDNFKTALTSITKEYPKTDVADRAQNILDFIKKQSLAKLPDSLRQDLEPDFIIEQTGGQCYVLVIKDDKIDIPDVVTKMTQFNEEYHQFDNLRTNSIMSGEGYQLIMIREFTDYQKALAYIKDVDMLDYIRKMLKIQGPFKHFIISTNNLKKVLKDKKVDSYEKIFSKQYTPPTSPQINKQLPK